MSRVVLRWTLDRLVKNIVATLLNKYDFFIVIEGNTGTGKSTLAYHIGSRVSREFRRLYNLREETFYYYYGRVGKSLRLSEEEFLEKILDLKEKNAYRFSPRDVLIYTQDAIQEKLSSWNCISIPDELINMTFNRDFFSQKQKDIIKMINMFRDHENLTLACVPQFQVIDNQVKNLTKMRITVKRRGLALIHTQNKTVYCKDRWDSATNEKIEREWIMKKIGKPNYAKLTTFRGLMRFPPLTKNQEKVYQEIKNSKRSVVLKEEMHVGEKEKDPFERVMEKVLAGGIRNRAEIEGIAFALGFKCSDNLVSKITRELKKLNKPSKITLYYWDKREKKETEREKNVIEVLNK